MSAPVLDSRAVPRHWLVFLGLLALVAATSWFMPPFAQDPTYRQIAQTHRMLGMAKFWNVATSLAFLLVGAMGLARMLRGPARGVLPELRVVYMTLFAGTVLVGLGSGWYHLNPDNTSLVFDRLPISIVFIALTCLVVGEHFMPALGRDLLAPLLLLGVALVGFWRLMEQGDHGDLRLYALMQSVPMVLVPLVLCLRPSRLNHAGVLWIPLVGYALARACDMANAWVGFGQAFGGDVLKNLIASMGLSALVWAVDNRRLRV